MFTVKVEKECGCFKKSEYEALKSFERREDAYNYSKVLEELMNEEFCKKHLFFAKRVDDTQFMIKVSDNPRGAGCCGGGHCD